MSDYFLHIPKTGGTSLTKIVDTFYQPEDIFPHQVWNQVMADYPPHFDYKLFRGHFSHGFRHQIGTANCFTFLRNPVERAISHFHHMTVDRLNNNWVFDFPYDSIEGILDEQPWILSNVQTKHIGLDLDITKIAPPYYGVIERQHADSKTFQNACEHLKTFKYVGFLEKYQRSLTQLCGVMGWKDTEAVHENKLPNRPATRTLPRSVLRKIKAINEYDLRLYEFAKSIFK